MTKNDVEKWAAENTDCSFDRIKKGYDWNGYEVWETVYDKSAFVGLPIVILVMGDEIRESTPEEGLEYLDYSENKAKKG